MPNLSVKVGVITLLLSVEVDFRRCFSVALRVRWRHDGESGNTTKITSHGCGVEVGPGRTSGQHESSLNEWQGTEKKKE